MPWYGYVYMTPHRQLFRDVSLVSTLIGKMNTIIQERGAFLFVATVFAGENDRFVALRNTLNKKGIPYGEFGHDHRFGQQSIFFPLVQANFPLERGPGGF
jgi:hypothetical protein